MKTPKISVVISVYNIERFVSQCLESVASQSLRSLEILCVNDASNDSSRDILESFSAKDTRIRILDHPTNQGLPATRNTGLSAASGEFIYFLDGDDFIKRRSLEKLYSAAIRDGCDAVLGLGRAYSNGETRPFRYLERFTNEVRNAAFRYERRLWRHGSVFLYLWKHEFLTRNELRFNESFNIGEDIYFTSLALPKTKGVTLLPYCFYRYRINTDSLIRKTWSAKEHTELIELPRLAYQNLTGFPDAQIAMLIYSAGHRTEKLRDAICELPRTEVLELIAKSVYAYKMVDARFLTREDWRWCSSYIPMWVRVAFPVFHSEEPELIYNYLLGTTAPENVSSSAAELEEVYNSFSWKITDPLRKLFDRIRRIG